MTHTECGIKTKLVDTCIYQKLMGVRCRIYDNGVPAKKGMQRGRGRPWGTLLPRCYRHFAHLLLEKVGSKAGLSDKE